MAKRSLDVVGALLGLILLSPFFAAIALAVWFTLGRPILFSQLRPGFEAKPFLLYKFRTMLDLRDDSGKLLSDEERLPPFGRLLRSSSLDELPELWNVLKGDMSLVGPRPLLMEYLDLYTPQQARRHHAKPGLTGWAQVKGRNAISWEEKFELDLWYVDNRSSWLDAKIILLTVLSVLKRQGISQPGRSTVEYFTGSKVSNSGLNRNATQRNEET